MSRFARMRTSFKAQSRRLNLGVLHIRLRPAPMWRPAERIRHDAKPGVWPTAAEAAASRLFSPIEVGSLKLAQRTWVPAMVPWRASDDGFVTPDVLDWYECFARGQPGAIVVEATGIRDVPSGPRYASATIALCPDSATSSASCARPAGAPPGC